MSRANQWFVQGEGIAREVITADIQRYLGPDALVRPGPGTGEYEGRSGYWITAYRTLTTQMIQDLKLDSQRWQQEQGRQEGPGRGGSPYAQNAQKSPKVSRHPNDSLVAYQDSRTHAARQHWGPSQAQEAAAAAAYEPPRQPARAPQYTAPQHGQSSYAADQHYTTAPTTAYSSSPYATPAATPRTQPDTYANYPQTGGDHRSYTTPQYSYPQHAAQDPYRQPAAPPPTHGYAAPSSAAAPGYYIASDGRQYPLPAQQPAQPQRQPQPRRSNP